MSSVVADRRTEPWFRRLYLPAYRITDVARYAHTNVNTVSSWHHRSTPVLPGRERRKPLSYLELVEVAFVAFFRGMGISMQRIRNARDYVAQNFNASYPFAEYVFKTEGFHVLMDYAQYDPGFKTDQIIVADAHGQEAWTTLMGDRFAEFDYEYELAMRWHPASRGSLVVIDPRISFGAPTVKGLPTWVIVGRWRAGESPDEIMDEFGIEKDAVRDALLFEGIPETS